MLGYTRDQFQAPCVKQWEALCHPDDVVSAKLALEQHINGDAQAFDKVVRMRHARGHWCWIQSRGCLINDGAGNPTKIFVGINQDVTERYEAYHQVQLLTQSLPGVIYSYRMGPNGDHAFTYVSSRVKEFYGISPETALIDPNAIFDLILPEDIERVRDSIKSSYLALADWCCEYRIRVGGRIRWVKGVARAEALPDGYVSWYGMVVYIDREKALEQELQRLSYTDELTGLFNRRHFIGQLEQLSCHTQRYGTAFSLISIDIDHFKEVNDTYGHLKGDEVLQVFARLLSARIRSTDLAARIGGEEFVVLLSETDARGARKLAESLRHQLENLRFESGDGRDFSVTMSAGVITRHSNSLVPFRELMVELDEMLYMAKRGGRNQVVLNDMSV